MDHRLAPAFWALRIGLGLGAFLAGLDKFFNILKVRMLSSETGSRATHA